MKIRTVSGCPIKIPNYDNYVPDVLDGRYTPQYDDFYHGVGNSDDDGDSTGSDE